MTDDYHRTHAAREASFVVTGRRTGRERPEEKILAEDCCIANKDFARVAAGFSQNPPPPGSPPAYTVYGLTVHCSY